MENETAILRRICHPNIVQLVEEYESAKEIFLVLELVQVQKYLHFAFSSRFKCLEMDIAHS